MRFLKIFNEDFIYGVFIKYCVFSKILIYFPDSAFPRRQCVYTHRAGQTPALQQNWQSSENHKIVWKNTIFKEHPVCGGGKGDSKDDAKEVQSGMSIRTIFPSLLSNFYVDSNDPRARC